MKEPSEESTITELEVVGGNYRNALVQCQDRLKYVKEGSIEEADTYRAMGSIYAEYLLDQEKALYYFNRAMEIHQNQKDEIGLADDYSDMSNIYIYIEDDISLGMEYLQMAEQIYDKYNLTDSIGFAKILVNKGYLYYQGEKYEDSLKELKKAQVIYEKAQEDNVTVYILAGKGYFGLQEYESAEKEYLKAQQICQNKNDKYQLSNVMFQMGELYCRLEKYDQAVEYLNQSLDPGNESELLNTDIASTYNNLAYCYARIPNMKKALEMSLMACRLINAEATTDKIAEKQLNYKNNLSVYWSKWYGSSSRSEFENWYQEIVLEGKEWSE